MKLGFVSSESLKSDEYVIEAATKSKTPKRENMEEVLGALSFKKNQKLITEGFIFENEEEENYCNHADDAIETFTKGVDQARKVHTFLENFIQYSRRKFEARLDEVSDILGSKPLYLEKSDKRVYN